MKKYNLFITALFSAFSFYGFAQGNETDSDGGAYPMEVNDATNPCITADEYSRVAKTCAENRKLLGLDKAQPRSANAVSLGWPLRAAANLTDCSYYTISAGVDHNAATGSISDYNCGTKTYDGHRGTDIPTYPFHFLKMDNNEVEVIAAAAGTILYKLDGNFDRNCAANALDANAIIITHADGSETHYWHMKSGSLTSKIVGQTVAAGEYLGVVGSSGSSSGPHLHFEVWSGSTVSTLVDPYAGSCNLMNANSWWATQKPYNDPAAIKVSTNTTDVVVPACPATETPNESNFFPIPFQGAGLPANYAKFYLFMRDEAPGTTATMTILNPNGTTFTTWTYTSTTYYNASYRGWSKLLPTVPGTYTFRAVYNGTTCSTTFDVGVATGMDEPNSTATFNVYPNPTNGKLTIESSAEVKDRTITFYNLLGEKVFQSTIEGLRTTLNLNEKSGVYFYRISNNNQTISSGKIVLQ